jgi:hypothetical protein
MRLGVIAALVFCLCARSLAGAAGIERRAELRVVGRSPAALWVVVDAPPGGQGVQRLVGTTRAEVSPGPSGFDPTSRAAFVTWREGDDRLWYSYSRDAGRTWTAPRESVRTLALRDAATAPHDPMPSVPAIGALPAEGKLYLVQFVPLALPEFRRALASLGADVLQHFPHHAHIVRIDPSRLADARAFPFVERVEPYHPWYRLEPALRDWLRSPEQAPRRIAVRVVALEWGEVGKRRIAAAAASVGAEVTALVPSGHVLELSVDRGQLLEIARHDDVLWIDRKTPPGVDMDLVRLDTGPGFLEGNPGYCGTGVRGEVLDLGIETTHQDLDGALLHGTNSASTHGTSVYGVLFGNGAADGDGNAAATGMLPCAQGISGDTNHLGDRFLHTQALLSAPYFASFQSNSWGATQTPHYTSASHDLDDIAWRLDLAITQSQSNTGTQDSRPEAWAKNVISVGGIRHQNTLALVDDDWGNFPGDCPVAGCSSIGPAEDGRVKPDLAHWNDAIFTTQSGNGYVEFGGTSASTPVTAGVIGLVLEMWADNVWGTDPVGRTVFEKRPHASTVKALLINSAQQYPFTGPSSELSRAVQGWGRPSANRAWQEASTSLVLDVDTLLEAGDEAAIKLEVGPGEDALRVTMVYPDPPGTLSASLHRINDLDLELRSPSDVIYHGNHGLLDGPWSTPGGSPNTIDTVENVFVESPEPGDWRVRVRAVEVNQDAYRATPSVDDVPFAFVATGATGLLCTAMQVSFEADPMPATVGDAVQFTPTVTGGAVGPKTFQWDLDGDGAVDTTDPAPVHVYHEPWSGVTQLSVRDADGCVEEAEFALGVEGPRITFDGFQGLSQVAGNGDATLDPGETWECDVRLLNDGSQTAFGVSAGIVPVSTNPGGVLLLQGSAAFGDIAPMATAVSQERYRFRLGHGYPCGESVTFTLAPIASATPSNVYPDESDALSLPIGTPCSPFGAPGAGRVAQLTVDLGPGDDVMLDWTPDCGNGTGYSVYRGTIAGGWESTAPALCDHPMTSTVLAGGAESEFYFVTPSGPPFEGSSGLRGDGSERPPPPAACYVQDIDDVCP